MGDLLSHLDNLLFLVSKIFFSSNLVGRIFFPPKCFAGFFFPSSFLCRIIFFLKKVLCLHLHHMNFIEQQNYNFFL